ncbi:phage tail tape measure protein [Desulfuromonas sp. TF]|uniref:phage tail tape measure protein n=1 Tax=Desulfuromonas sp. TF TaxID=1232410 RepID=UPI000400F8B8|nr:phage tail tape measure protein [Desulfuromonas sp. TF]
MDANATLQLLIKASDQTGAVFSGVGDKVSALASGAKTATQPFADIATSVLKLDAALAALVGGGLALAVNESGKFNGAFAETTTLFEAAPEKVDRFRADILDYAGDSRIAIEDINAATYSAISAGMDYADSLDLVERSERLAIAGKADLNSSTVLLASSLNAYGESVDQAEAYSDALFATVRAGQTTLPELAASLAQVTGVAASSGVSFDDLLAAVATLTASGLPTSQAVTAIKGALTNILKPSADAAETSKALGLEFNATALASKGLGGFMAELGQKTGGNIDKMSALFGSVEGLNGALILTGEGAAKFAATLGEMEDKAGATSAAYDKMAGEMDLVNQRLANNTKLALIAVGDKIKDDYAGFVGSLVEVFQSLSGAVASGEFDGLFEVVEAGFKRAETALENIAKNLPAALEQVDLSGLAGSLGELGDSLGGLFEGVDLSTPEGLAAAVAGVADTLESLIDFSRGLVEGLKPFFNLIMEGIEHFNSLDDSAKASAGGLTGFLTGVNGLMGPLGGVADSIGAVGTGLEALAGASLVKTVAGLAGSGGLTAALLGATATAVEFTAAVAAPVAAFAATGYALYKLGGEVIAWQEAETDAAIAADRAAASAERLAEKYAAISEATGETITSTRDLRDAVEDGRIHFDEATKSWQSGAAAQRDFAAEVAAAALSSYDYRTELAGMIDDQGNLKGAVTLSSTSLAEQRRETVESLVAMGNTREMAEKMAAGLLSIEPAAQGAGAALEETGKKSKEAELKLLDLASNERIKAMEFRADFDIAALASDVEITKTLFSSIDAAIESTGSLLGSLTGDLLNADTAGQKWLIEGLIEDENKRREQAFELEKKTLEMRLELMRLSEERIRNGDAGIKVSLDESISPALEMVLQEIVGHLQVWVNESSEAYLLAAGGGA